jgi:hypothetical protein
LHLVHDKIPIIAHNVVTLTVADIHPFRQVQAAFDVLEETFLAGNELEHFDVLFGGGVCIEVAHVEQLEVAGFDGGTLLDQFVLRG